MVRILTCVAVVVTQHFEVLERDVVVITFHLSIGSTSSSPV